MAALPSPKFPRPTFIVFRYELLQRLSLAAFATPRLSRPVLRVRLRGDLYGGVARNTVSRMCTYRRRFGLLP